MRCPFCHHKDSKVLDSRATEEGASIRRRRECTKCSRRFTTYERLDQVPFMIVKKDGRREAFSRDKILNGVLKACEKRPISPDQIEKMIDDIEKDVRNTTEREITSNEVGEIVMERLKELDEVAYVRFASVYRQFKDINSFMSELQQLLEGE
ncbi:MAG: transcriptional repressor NrdR [Firmicutes bacterium]|nr:transcriptional repressor NrdR [Bacillota bacterium]